MFGRFCSILAAKSFFTPVQLQISWQIWTAHTKKRQFLKGSFLFKKTVYFFSFSVKYKERYDRWNKFTFEEKVTSFVRWLFVTLKRIFLSFFTYKNTIIFSNVNKEKIFQLIVKLILLWFFCEKCRAGRGWILFGFFGVGFT